MGGFHSSAKMMNWERSRNSTRFMCKTENAAISWHLSATRFRMR
jgi:hypothetical protein